MRYSVPVDTDKRQARQAGDWGHISGKTTQEGVNPPSLQLLCGEGGPVGICNLKLSRQNPKKIIRE